MIRFLDLQQVNAQYSNELEQAAIEIIKSGWYLMGERLKRFEINLAAYIGVRNAIGVANGLDALRLILKAYMEIGFMHEGDEVIVPANTYIATILAITDNRLKPVLVEPDISTYNLDIRLIRRHLTSRTRAIMVVHLYGRVCWNEELENIAKAYNLKIIEDNAQAIGAVYKYDSIERRSGSLGDASANSFYPGKNLGALGDAGAITTNDDLLAEVVSALRNYGSKQKYINLYQGLNSRLDELNAAFLDIKLKYLDAENLYRRRIAKRYCEGIINPAIILPADKDFFKLEIRPNSMDLSTNKVFNYLSHNPSHVWHLFVIRTVNRDKLQQYLTRNGIETIIHYPIPPHKQSAYKEWNKFSFPITERIHDEVLSLPMSSVIKDEDIETVITVINSY